MPFVRSSLSPHRAYSVDQVGIQVGLITSSTLTATLNLHNVSLLDERSLLDVFVVIPTGRLDVVELNAV